MAASLLNGWRNANGKWSVKGNSKGAGATHSTKPSNGRYKLNTDAAISGSGYTSLGWVLRDADGGFIAATGMRLKGSFTSKEAETLCIREALRWAKNLGYDKLDVETDAQ
ncbi:hypothetical protein OROMI_010771 [Orobanche minor]